MKAYVFLVVKPGSTKESIELIEGDPRFERAVPVAGKVDIVAKTSDITDADLTDLLLEGLPQLLGDRLVSSTTSIVVPLSFLDSVGDFPLPIKPIVAPAAALVFADFLTGAGPAVVKSLGKLKSVEMFAVLTGEHDVLIEVGGSDFEEITKKVIADIQSIDGITSTSTAFILEDAPKSGAV